LPKRRCSFDRRFVDAHLGTHRVNTSIRCQVGNYFPLGGCRGLMVWVVVLNNVVLDQRICRPAIDGEVRVAIGFKGTSPIYGPWWSLVIFLESEWPGHRFTQSIPRCRTWVPSFTTYEITSAVPSNRVSSVSKVFVFHACRVICPERIEPLCTRLTRLNDMRCCNYSAGY
jgi:hypothetical protein